MISLRDAGNAMNLETTDYRWIIEKNNKPFIYYYGFVEVIHFF